MGLIWCLLGNLQPPPHAPTKLEVELCWLEVLPSFDVIPVARDTVFLHICAIVFEWQYRFRTATKPIMLASFWRIIRLASLSNFGYARIGASDRALVLQDLESLLTPLVPDIHM